MSTILVVDDHPGNRRLLVSLLGYKGHRVLEAEDGRDGLELTRAERPDLVIADVLMPVMDGYEFVRRLREDAEIADTRVIFYTANYLEGDARQLAARCGVTTVLTKPAEAQQILDVVEGALGVSTGPAPIAAEEFSHSHLRLVTDKLAEKVQALEVASSRLAALVHLGQALAAEPDSHRLLATFIREAREILGAQSAAVGILEDEGPALRRFATAGREPVPDVAQVLPTEGLLGQVLAQEPPLRCSPPNPLDVAALPSCHRTALSFLGVRVATAARRYGWIYFIDKPGAGHFTVDDERVASLLGSQIGLAYENADRLERIGRHASELELRVLERTDALTRSNEELEQFAYAASHDLQEPLRTVGSFVQLLWRRHREHLDAEAKEFIDYAVDGVTRMRQLIDDLLAYSRIGRTGVDPVPTDANTVLDAALESLRSAIAETGATITREPLPCVLVARVELQQLLTNLVGNGLKFHGPSPPHVSICSRPDGELVVFSVRDNGIGIDPKHFERIFVVFQRLHGRTEYSGTGIGLAICKKIVDRHHGHLWVESRPGEGATFSFTLPRATEAADA